MEGTSVQNDSNTTCHIFSQQEFNTIFIAKVSLCSLSLVVCLLSIAIIVISRGYKRFIHRLVLYFMIAVFFQALATILEFIPVEHRADNLVVVKDNWDIPCSIFAFMDQMSLWMGIFIIVWIKLYLLRTVWYLDKKPGRDETQCAYYQKVSRREVVGVSMSILLPLTFNWVPFSMNMYGLSGVWCWIKISKDNCGDEYRTGLTLMFSLYYGPLILMVLFSTIALLVMIGLLCKHSYRMNGSVRKRYLQVTREMAIILIYPVLFNIICIIPIVNRIDSAIRTSQKEEPFYPLWLAHALANPFRVLIPPLAFLLHPGTWKNLLMVRFCPERVHPYEEYYEASRATSATEDLIARGKPEGSYYGTVSEVT